MNRRDLLRLAGLAGLGGTLAACGIEDNSGVVVDGLAPTSGSGLPQSLRNGPRARHEIGLGQEEDFITAFLESPAGNYGDSMAHARDFMSTAAVENWKPASNINIIRLLGKPTVTELPNDWEATFSVMHVGVLTSDNRIDPPVASSPVYTIRFARGAEAKKDGYFVTQAPPDILMSESALRFYVARNLYFWNSSNTALVPDLRYFPYTVDGADLRNDLVRLLTLGPAPWLTRAVTPLPQRLSLIGKPVTKDDALVINLTSEARTITDLGKLASQFSWTLHRELTDGALHLELQIESDPKPASRDYLPDNLAYHKDSDPKLFAIEDGEVIRPAGGGVPLLRADENRLIEIAAITADYKAIAVVKVEGGLRRLYLGRRSDGAPTPLLATQLKSTGPMSRPIWLSNETVLVAAKGGLYQVWDGDTSPKQIATPRTSGAVTWAAIGQDARRIALICGGRLYVAAMDWYGSGAATLGEARLIPTSLHHLTTVAFTHQDRLVLAGAALDGATAIVEISIDGAGEDRHSLPSNFGQATVEAMSAYELSPTDSSRTPLVVFTKSQRSFELSPVRDLRERYPAPSPSPGTKTAVLTKPFYAE